MAKIDDFDDIKNLTLEDILRQVSEDAAQLIEEDLRAAQATFREPEYRTYSTRDGTWKRRRVPLRKPKP